MAAQSIDVIRRRRVLEWLPTAMRKAGVDLFVVFTREGAPDPFAQEVGLGKIGGRSAGVFYVDSSGDFHRTAIAPRPGRRRVEASGVYDLVSTYGPEGVGPHLAAAIQTAEPHRIALNTSHDLALADGLTKGMHDHLAELIGPDLAARAVSSEPLVLSLLGRKFPEEVASIERAAVATQDVLLEVLSPGVMRPGTTVRAIADAIGERMRSRGMAVAFNTIRIAGRSPDGASIEDVVGAGELVTIDAGAVHEGYCSDIQRTAYVLRDGETTAPADLQAMWDATVAAQRAAIESLRPGSTGVTVDSAARGVIQAAGFKEFPHATGHSLGRRVHDVGPMLGPAWPAYGSLVHVGIESGQVFAIEPMVYAPVASQGGEVRMGLEEDVVVEAAGPRVFGVPQTRLILVP